MAKNVPKRLHIWKSAKIDLDNVLTMNIWSRVSIYLIGFGSLNLVFIPKNSIFIKNTLLLKKKEIEHGRGKNIKPKQSWFERHRLGGVELQKYRKVENLTFFSFSIRKKN